MKREVIAKERLSAYRQKIYKAHLVARKLVKVQCSANGWAVTINGWMLTSYDSIKTKAEAERCREIVIQHLDSDLWRAGVK